MFTAALLTTAKSSYMCIHTHTHTHKEEYYSATKKNENFPFATTWMDSEDIMLSETSDTERQILYDITYMWNLKIRQTSKYNKKETLRNRKETSGYQVGRGKG